MPTKKTKTVSKEYLQSLARGYTDASMRALGSWATASVEVDPEIRIKAIGMLLDRGWGRPESTTTTKHEGGESPIEFVIRNLNAEKKKNE